MNTKLFYVYALLDPSNFYLPIYIGKGSRKSNNDPYTRPLTHLLETIDNTDNKRKIYKINSIRRLGFEPVVKILQEFENEIDAYNEEARLIKSFGRKKFDSDGILTNICIDNRPPNATGRKHPNRKPASLETRRKISIAQTGLKRTGSALANIRNANNNPIKRKKISDALKGRPLSEQHKQSMRKPKPKGFGIGRIHSAITRQRISQKLTGRKMPLDQRLRLSNSLRGRKFSVEHKRKLALIWLGRKHTQESIQKMRDVWTPKRRQEQSVRTTEMNKCRPPASIETKAKISATLTGKKQSQETRDKRTKTRLATIEKRKSEGKSYKQTDEQCKARSILYTGRKQSQDVIDKRIATNRIRISFMKLSNDVKDQILINLNIVPNLDYKSCFHQLSKMNLLTQLKEIMNNL